MFRLTESHSVNPKFGQFGCYVLFNMKSFTIFVAPTIQLLPILVVNYCVTDLGPIPQNIQFCKLQISGIGHQSEKIRN